MQQLDPMGAGGPSGPFPPTRPNPDSEAQMRRFETLSAQVSQLTPQVKASASWFYWIAALSVINSIIAMTSSKIAFVFGLGITGLVDAMIKELAKSASPIGLVFSLFAAGIYVLFGYFAGRRIMWVYIMGLVFYCLDALLVLVAMDFIGIAVHAYVIFRLSQGLKVSSTIAKLEAQMSQGQAPIR